MKKTYLYSLIVVIIIGTAILLYLVNPGELISIKQEESKVESKDTITLTMNGEPSQVSFVSGVQTDMVAKKIESVTGVKLDIDMQWSEDKFASAYASGDLPDILIIDDSSKIKPLIKGEYVVNLEKIIQKSAPAIVSNYWKQLDFSKQYYDYNGDGSSGGFYFIPTGVSPGEPTFKSAPWVRWDYYKEMNYPTMNNMDELLEVLYQMQQAHPLNEKGNKVYGISTWFNSWKLWNVVNFPAAYYGILNQDNILDLHADTHALTSVILDKSSSFWMGAQFLNKANRMQLLDPESFTQNYSQALQKVIDGRVLMTTMDWQVITSNKLFASKGESKGFMPMPMVGNMIIPVVDSNMGSHFYAISTKCKYPERALGVIQYLLSEEGSRDIVNGVKDVNWVESNGKASMLPNAVQALREDANYVMTSGARKYSNHAGLLGFAKDANGQRIDLMKEPDMLISQMTPLEKEWSQHFNVSYPTAYLEKSTAVSSVSGIWKAIKVQNPPNDILDFETKLDSYLMRNMSQLVFAKTDEEFNHIQDMLIQELRNKGYDKAMDYELKNWKDAMEKGSKYLK